MDYTTQQKQALDRLKQRWAIVSKPYPLLGGNGCIMVDVEGAACEGIGGAYSACYSIGIERDGHMHS
tara:strand:- start:427 stop:627 length:201 start_codon:yes stop_codon:yes gene_type:complete